MCSVAGMSKPHAGHQVEQTKPPVCSFFSLTQGKKAKWESSHKHFHLILKGLFLVSTAVSKRKEAGCGKTLATIIKMQQEKILLVSRLSMFLWLSCIEDISPASLMYQETGITHVVQKAVFSFSALEAHLLGIIVCLTTNASVNKVLAKTKQKC